MVGHIFMNKESKNFYRVERVDSGLVHVERLGDGKAVRVSKSRWEEVYRPATEDEVQKIKRVIAICQASGEIVNLDKLPRDEEGSEPMQESQIGGVQVGELIEPNAELHVMDKMVLYPECVESALMGINQIMRKDDLEEIFQISKIQPKAGRCALNMYGPPGTGKTMLALAIALKLGKKLFKVDYSQMISKWVGDTGKHIKMAFLMAKQHDAILFFDEADSLLSKRLTFTEDAVSNSVNQNRNILMQELDNYDGIVFFTTNMFVNYDEALLRRIAAHVKFDLPNEDMRVKLFEMHFPNPTRLKAVDFKKASKLADGFGGGDILNVALNSMRRCANLTEDKSQWFVTQEMIEAEIKRVRDAKAEHSGKKGKRAMGLAGGEAMRDY
jgi:DNA polymerase III delta prime subunit